MAAGKEFSAVVPDEEYDFFTKNFPIYGATKWFINSSLKEFNQKVRDNPSIRQLVIESIEEMVQLGKDAKKSNA